MAENFVIEAQSRNIVGKKVSQLRRQGIVPVTVYGPKSEPVNLQVEYRPLQLALLKAGGTNLIQITVNGKATPVLAREVQRDILRNDIMHVDFFAVDMSAKITIDVPLHFVGESAAVSTKKGILVTGPTTLAVETLPSHLLNQIEIDISNLNEVGDSIHVRDLKLDSEITVLNDPDEMIARISQPAAARSEEDAAAEAAEGVGEVEIIKKGKADEEDEG
ncbi:MAG: 50S ribosomal protein L25 [Chloroflexi bacterium]|nr:50S ribosomal protein L25 [Chloroflexota bacterium]MCC6896504.1 50S ribosomal protein L25 [Anaerolineae bacterium]